MPTFKHILAVSAACIVVGAGAGIRYYGNNTGDSVGSFSGLSTCTDCHGAAPEQDPLMRRAERLQARLQSRGLPAPALHTLAEALSTLRSMQRSSVVVHVSDASGDHSASWEFVPSSMAGLVRLHTTPYSAKVQVDRTVLTATLQAGADTTMQASVQKQGGTVVTDRGLERFDASGPAHGGFMYDAGHAEQIATAWESGQHDVVLMAPYKEAQIVLEHPDGTSDTLTLIAAGKSNFDESPDNREANVLKALTEHVHNVVIQPGEEFSFNSTLDGPVTLDKGWKEALGLFGGGAAPTPGGGICQAATTVYRAAMMAGLPMVERRNHSLYVSYYEQYGVGIDATIFPGVHDLRFVNDTGAPIVIQAFAEGRDAYVQFFGKDDGRTVELTGPYFAIGAKRPVGMRALGWNDIGWTRTIRKTSGQVITEHVVSHYAKPVPRSLAVTYTPATLTYDEPVSMTAALSGTDKPL